MTLPAELTISDQDKLKKLFSLGYFRDSEWDSVKAFTLGSTKVKEAVEEYRDFHGLPPGDTVDEKTTTQLFLPRCGLPDMVRPMDAALCKWSFLNVTCAMALYGLQPLPSDVEDELWDVVLGNWNAVCGINLTRIASLDAANIYSEVGNMSGGTLAYSYLPCGPTTPATRLQQKFNAATNWTKPLFVQVGTHEVGHAIGFDHGPSGSLMQPTANGQITKPQAWDIEQAQLRYGKPKPKPPEEPPTPPPQSAGRIVIPAGVSLVGPAEFELVQIGGSGSGWDSGPN